MREDDHRANSSQHSEYRSPIGRFLRQFAEYCPIEGNTFKPVLDPLNESSRHILDTYKYIHEVLHQYVYLGSMPGATNHIDQDIGVVSRDHFKSVGLKSLFKRQPVLGSESKIARCLNEITSSDRAPTAEGLIRLILFAAYLSERVVLTRVEAQNETDAFDIFDALNTTGEPLTAIEACKPMLVRFENESTHADRREPRQRWEAMEQKLTDEYPDTAKRQTEMKTVVNIIRALFRWRETTS